MQNLECSIGVDTDVQGAIQHDSAAGQGVFYLDRGNTAGCSGQVERIKYCYHSQLGVSTNTTEAQFSIYRRRGFIYIRVSDVFRIRNHLPFETSNELQCEYLELEMAVQVEEGDAFGICLPNSGGNEVLSILSESSGGTLNTLPCDVVPQDNFFRFALSESSDVRLHLYAITSKNLRITYITFVLGRSRVQKKYSALMYHFKIYNGLVQLIIFNHGHLQA